MNQISSAIVSRSDPTQQTTRLVTKDEVKDIVKEEMRAELQQTNQKLDEVKEMLCMLISGSQR